MIRNMNLLAIQEFQVLMNLLLYNPWVSWCVTSSFKRRFCFISLDHSFILSTRLEIHHRCLTYLCINFTILCEALNNTTCVAVLN